MRTFVVLATALAGIAVAVASPARGVPAGRALAVGFFLSKKRQRTF